MYKLLKAPTTVQWKINIFNQKAYLLFVEQISIKSLEVRSNQF